VPPPHCLVQLPSVQAPTQVTGHFFVCLSPSFAAQALPLLAAFTVTVKLRVTVEAALRAVPVGHAVHVLHEPAQSQTRSPHGFELQHWLLAPNAFIALLATYRQPDLARAQRTCGQVAREPSLK